MKQPCGMYVETQGSVCFSSALFFLYIVHVQSSTCLWYKCGIFPHADQIGTCISITSPATETVSN